MPMKLRRKRGVTGFETSDILKHVIEGSNDESTVV